MLRVITSLLACLLIATTLYSCNSGATKQAQILNEQVKAYGSLIRWRAYDDASSFIKLREGGNVVLDHDLLNEIRVTKYRVDSIIMSEDHTEANVVAEISYYHERVNNVHIIRDEQLWWKDQESGRWLLDGGLPAFKP